MRLKQLCSKNKNAKNIYELLLCTLCLIACAFAWFFNGHTATSEGVEFTSISAVDMGVSLDGENFSNSLSISMPDNLVFEPVSGTGQENKMYIAELPEDSEDVSEAVNWNEVTYDSGAEQNSFFTFPLYFRSDNPGYIVLTNLSVDPTAAPEDRQDDDYTDKNGNAVSASGTVTRSISNTSRFSLVSNNPMFTKDYIAGAARIGMVNKTNGSDSSVLEDALVLANDTYQLTYAITDDKCNCTIQENAASVSDGYYYNGSELEKYSENDDLNVFTQSQVNGGTSVNILKLEANDDGKYLGQIEVYLWLEGNDPEAKDILAGGQISFSMTFDYLAELSE